MVKKPVMTIEDALRLRHVSDPQLSPDGSAVVYVVPELDEKRKAYRNDLWWVSTRGGASRQLTCGKTLAEPRWSPGARHIAFLRPGEESKASQIWLLPMEGGEARCLTRIEEGVHGIDWSPDAASLLFLSLEAPGPEEKGLNEKGGIRVVDRFERMNQLWVVDVTSGRCRQLTRDRSSKAAARWSPDGRHIAFEQCKASAPKHPGRSSLWVMEATGKGKRRLCTGEGCATAPRWSPDGKHIAYLRRELPASAHLNQLAVVRLSSPEASMVLTERLDRSVADHHWSSDGKRLYGLVCNGPHRHVYSVTFPGGRVRQLTQGDRALHSLRVAGKTMVFVSETPTAPGEVHVAAAGASAGGERVLTDMNPQVKGMAMGRTHMVRWRAPDGLEIEGALVLPPGYRRGQQLPLAVEAHGGPAAVRGYGFDGRSQVLAGRGFAQLAPNFRGSSGYGRAFMSANKGDLADGPFQDIMAGVDAMIDKGIADPDRLAMVGDSYGGYMTAWAIGHTTRFRAAVAGCAVIDLQSFFGTGGSRQFARGLPWEAPQLYIEKSPITYVGRIATPTLIYHGEEDRVVPIGQSEQLYVSLRECGLDVEFVRYPREGHSLQEYVHRRDSLERTVAWLERWVMGRTRKARRARVW